MILFRDRYARDEIGFPALSTIFLRSEASKHRRYLSIPNDPSRRARRHTSSMTTVKRGRSFPGQKEDFLDGISLDIRRAGGTCAKLSYRKALFKASWERRKIIATVRRPAWGYNLRGVHRGLKKRNALMKGEELLFSPRQELS